MKFEKIGRTIFEIYLFPRFKIELPNLDFHQLFCSKRLMQSKKRVKRRLYIEFKENRLNLFGDIHFRSYF